MNLNSCNRILILGCSGSGKSTMTRFLGQKFDLPPVHLDVFYWNPGWIETPKDQMREKIMELVKNEKWVMDGNFTGTFDLRFPLADKIVIVNLPRYTCLFRVLKRVFLYNKKRRRPDMAEGCDECFDFEFYKYIWSYNKKVLPRIFQAIDHYSDRNKLIYLRSAKEVDAFIQGLH